MEKLLVDLSVPTIQKNFEILVPQDVPIRTITAVIADGVKNLCPSRYTPSGNETLLIMTLPQPLNPDLRLCDYSLRHGTKLVLL